MTTNEPGWSEQVKEAVKSYAEGNRAPWVERIICQDYARQAELLEKARKTLKECKFALGAHGPCRNNSCQDCGATWRSINSVLELIQAQGAGNLESENRGLAA